MSIEIAEADQARVDAAAAVGQAEADLSAGRRGVSAAALNKLRDTYRHAALSAEGLRAKADRDREKARLEALREVGHQVDELADAGLGELGDILQTVADACARAWEISRAWDDSVRELVGAAVDLGAAKGMPPGEPPRTAGHLAVQDRGGAQSITHHRTRLEPVSAQLAQAIERATLGRPYDGLALLLPAVTKLPEPRRPDLLGRGRSGMVIPVFGQPDAQMERQIRSGDLEVLPDSAIDAYMAGELQ